MTWIEILCFSVNCAALAYGGYTDWKRREIPNAVPLTLLLTGLLHWRRIPLQLACMAAMMLILWFSAKLTKSPLPGGDFKLLCALTFSAGPTVTLTSVLLTGLAASAAGLAVKKPLRRHIPLCTYMAPAYLSISFVILSGFAIFQ